MLVSVVLVLVLLNSSNVVNGSRSLAVPCHGPPDEDTSVFTEEELHAALIRGRQSVVVKANITLESPIWMSLPITLPRCISIRAEKGNGVRITLTSAAARCLRCTLGSCVVHIREDVTLVDDDGAAGYPLQDPWHSVPSFLGVEGSAQVDLFASQVAYINPVFYQRLSAVLDSGAGKPEQAWAMHLVQLGPGRLKLQNWSQFKEFQPKRGIAPSTGWWPGFISAHYSDVDILKTGQELGKASLRSNEDYVRDWDQMDSRLRHRRVLHLHGHLRPQQVGTDEELFRAVRNESVEVILLRGVITMDPERWKQEEVEVKRSLTIAAAANSSATLVVPRLMRYHRICCFHESCRIIIQGPDLTIIQNLTGSIVNTWNGAQPQFINFPPDSNGTLRLLGYTNVIDHPDMFFYPQSQLYLPDNTWWSRDIDLACLNRSTLLLRRWLLTSGVNQQVYRGQDPNWEVVPSLRTLLIQNILMRLSTPPEVAPNNELCSAVEKLQLQLTSTSSIWWKGEFWWLWLLIVLLAIMSVVTAWLLGKKIKTACWKRKAIQGQDQGYYHLHLNRAGPVSSEGISHGSRLQGDASLIVEATTGSGTHLSPLVSSGSGHGPMLPSQQRPWLPSPACQIPSPESARTHVGLDLVYPPPPRQLELVGLHTPAVQDRGPQLSPDVQHRVREGGLPNPPRVLPGPSHPHKLSDSPFARLDHWLSELPNSDLSLSMFQRSLMLHSGPLPKAGQIPKLEGNGPPESDSSSPEAPNTHRTNDQPTGLTRSISQTNTSRNSRESLKRDDQTAERNSPRPQPYHGTPFSDLAARPWTKDHSSLDGTVKQTLVATAAAGQAQPQDPARHVHSGAVGSSASSLHSSLLERCAHANRYIDPHHLNASPPLVPETVPEDGAEQQGPLRADIPPRPRRSLGAALMDDYRARATRRRSSSSALAMLANNPFGCDVLCKIGSGGCGSVYKVSLNGETLAMKVIRHQVDQRTGVRKARALGEAVLGGRLRHPNILRTLDYRVVDPRDFYQLCSLGTNNHRLDDPEEYAVETYILMEYCDMGTLRSLVRQTEWQPCNKDFEAAVGILLDVAAAVQYLQDHHVIHGDLKCNNVLLSIDSSDERGFAVKVCDFGISRMLQSVSRSHTVLSRPQGTLSHMSPELIQHKHMSKACDIYAFGVMIYEVMTGKAPFYGFSYANVIYTVTMGKVAEALQFGEDCPPEMVKLAHWCWAKSPKERPCIRQIISSLASMSPEALWKLQEKIKAVGPAYQLRDNGLDGLDGLDAEEVGVNLSSEGSMEEQIVCETVNQLVPEADMGAIGMHPESNRGIDE